ncbi:hypothetical protein DFH07DRAFT_797566 [Mycena maculata]|uniref:DUF7330 domain-containing protein n=1 Tax=Mycena maculata TaxID=230809 RepID=A0AAD7K3L7_9AGAR|nr:hypothetical protein DFH07DRAFT_797566 [Mycena maculata]
MDVKTPLQSENLPAPVSHAVDCAGHKKKSKKHRIFKTIVLSTLIWVGVRHFGRARSAFNLADPVSWPIPDNVSVDHCAEWSTSVASDVVDDFPYAADASFELPVSAETLFLISRSARHRAFAAGHVNYVQSEDVSDTVKVDITARFWLDEYLDASKVCLLKRGEDESGVGIFTKWDRGRHSKEHEKLRFEVTVTFPQTSEDSPLAIKKLSTDLEIFTQIFGDVSNINFNSLFVKGSLGGVYAETLSTENAKIRTSLGAIKIQSLIAEDADVSTSMGPIEGTYNSSNVLVLHTSNGAINVDVNLFNEGEDPAKLRMHTSNGFIQGKINLESSKGPDASFDLAARTSNSRIALDVLASPLDATLALRATTSIGSVSVKLPTTYEGSFDATTSLAGLSVTFDEKAEDPAGEGRKRSIEFEGVRRNRAKGRVGWSEEGLARGTVSVRSSMAPVSLEF